MLDLKKTLVAATALAAVGAPTVAGAARIEMGDQTHLDVHGYLQPRLALDPDAGADEPLQDFYLRRARLLVMGQVTPKVDFFLGTLDKDVAREGDYSARTQVVDAWMGYAFSPALRVDAGLMRMPFTRHAQGSGKKLHGMDFHTGMTKRSGALYHARDLGVHLRGLLWGQRIDYRVAVVDGAEPGEEGGANGPRFVGRVGVNAFEAEPGLYRPGTWLGKKKVLTVGASFDLEPGATESGDLYRSFAVDAFGDLPVGENELVFTLTGLSYGPGGAMEEGWGAWGDLGFRMGEWEPLVAAEALLPTAADANRQYRWMGGLNWWFDGYTANLKLEAGAQATETPDNTTWSPYAALQAQLGF